MSVKFEVRVKLPRKAFLLKQLVSNPEIIADTK